MYKEYLTLNNPEILKKNWPCAFLSVAFRINIFHRIQFWVIWEWLFFSFSFFFFYLESTSELKKRTNNYIKITQLCFY